jgi:phage gp29-like protein
VTRILDQFGQPIDTGVLKEPQTARVASLQNQYLTPMLGGLTPARLAQTLRLADEGSLFDQHRMFADMEERDAHLTAEMGKRKNAIVGLEWDIVPPRDASAAEKADADWVREVLQDGLDGVEDLLLAMMDAVGHGFAPVEMQWRRDDGEWHPEFHPRPQEWFQLNLARDRIHLNDGMIGGAALQAFGWLMHTPAKAKTGYAGRMGLMRTLAWPFLYKAYSLGDFAEFLETYGIPMIMGKYGTSATADEKASLLRAVNALGHDARAIMPKDMEIEIQQASGAAGQSGHLAMMEWADKALSKAILGQTLSADTGSGGGGSYALGKVHNEVRKDIAKGDARQCASTITRDLVFPLLVLNRSGVATMKRCPRFKFHTEDPADMSAMATNLPELVKMGIQVPLSWAQERLNIPMPQENEPVLKLQDAPPTAGSDPVSLSTMIGGAAAPVASPGNDDVAALSSAAAPTWSTMLAAIERVVNEADSLEALQAQLVEQFGGSPQDQLVKLMGAAFALAELKGMADVQDGR